MMLMMHHWPSITSPASQHPPKPFIFTTKWPASFCRSPALGSGFTSPEVTTQVTTPPHPLYSLRSLSYLKPSLSAGFRDISVFSPSSLLLGFYLRKKELATLTGRAPELGSVAGPCPLLVLLLSLSWLRP